MKEALKKARASFISANTELTDAIIAVIGSKGEEGFSFGEFFRPVVTDNMASPIGEPLAQYELTEARVSGDELQGRVAGSSVWYPLTFDPGDEELLASESLFSACMLSVIGG